MWIPGPLILMPLGSSYFYKHQFCKGTVETTISAAARDLRPNATPQSEGHLSVGSKSLEILVDVFAGSEISNHIQIAGPSYQRRLLQWGNHGFWTSLRNHQQSVDVCGGCRSSFLGPQKPSESKFRVSRVFLFELLESGSNEPKVVSWWGQGLYNTCVDRVTSAWRLFEAEVLKLADKCLDPTLPCRPKPRDPIPNETSHDVFPVGR